MQKNINYGDAAGLTKSTLCYIIKDDKILLAMKKRGFGEGYWNGYGGKQIPGESIEDTAKRETKEEIGIEALELEKVATLTFLFPEAPKDKKWNQEVSVFIIKRWHGEPKESDEMKPQWFRISEIPYDRMWDDDKYWLPMIASGKKLHGLFVFGRDFKSKEMSIEEESTGAPTKV